QLIFILQDKCQENIIARPPHIALAVDKTFQPASDIFAGHIELIGGQGFITRDAQKAFGFIALGGDIKRCAVRNNFTHAVIVGRCGTYDLLLVIEYLDAGVGQRRSVIQASSDYMKFVVRAALRQDADVGYHEGAAAADVIAVRVIGFVTGVVAFTVIPVTAGFVILLIPAGFLFARVIIQTVVIFRHGHNRFGWPFILTFIDGVTAVYLQLNAHQSIGVLRH